MPRNDNKPPHDEASSHHSPHHQTRRQRLRHSTQPVSFWIPGTEGQEEERQAEPIFPPTPPANISTQQMILTTQMLSLQLKFDNLATKMIHFPETYEERREQMDSQRFLSHFRTKTNTPVRKADAALIKNMAELIQSNRMLIETQDPSISVNALNAILQIQLKKIDESYKHNTLSGLFTSIRNSAMASCILDVLEIERFEQIEPVQFEMNLKALKKCLEIINAKQTIEDPSIIKLRDDVNQCLTLLDTAEHEAKAAEATLS